MKNIQKTLAVVFVFVSTLAFAQDKPVHEVYGAMLYSFTKYVQWPDHADGGEFVIGIVGNSDLYTTLNTWYGGKARGSKTYVVKKFNSAAEVTNCHVLFIDKRNDLLGHCLARADVVQRIV